MEIQDAKLYRGELSRQGSNMWQNTEKVWIVNGHIEKCDANFCRDFGISRIPFTNLNKNPTKNSKDPRGRGQ